MRPAIDETGNVYGEWTVLRRAEGGTNAKWVCRCSCGRQGLVAGSTLRTGKSRSCGKCNLYKVKPGMQFGNWTILDGEPVKQGNNILYHVRCKCGRDKYMRTSDMLKVGSCRECKRESMIIDETGHRYGKLVVLGRCEKPEFTAVECKTWWLCRCDCGNEVKATGAQLRKGQRVSCGCARGARKMA